jgi:hypothetical protein
MSEIVVCKRCWMPMCFCETATVTPHDYPMTVACDATNLVRPGSKPEPTAPFYRGLKRYKR